MNIQVYYGMDSNPFRKDIEIDSMFISNDFKIMINRLEFLLESRGIGVFVGQSGKGKTTILRKFLTELNPQRYKAFYICLTTVTVQDFYIALARELNIHDIHRKTTLFKAIREEFKRIVVENKMELVIAIDESQYLSGDILREFIMLFNFEIDSKDYVTVLLLGQKELIYTLNRRELEAFKQRINIIYTLEGFSDDEVKEYIITRFKSVHCQQIPMEEETYKTLCSLMKGSIRTLNHLMNRSLLIAMKNNKKYITSEEIKLANDEISISY